MSFQDYRNKIAEMPTSELVERIDMLWDTFYGGDSADAARLADETVAMKIAALEAEIDSRGVAL